MLVELHVHSKASDGLAKPEDIIKKAEKFLGAIAITDHDTMNGYYKVSCMKKKVIVIPGVEIACLNENEKGHVLCLGIDKMPKTKNLYDVIDFVHSNGGVAIAAHPFGGLLRPGFTNDDLLKKFDAIEVINGQTFSYQNKNAFEAAKRLNMPMTSGTDAHMLMDVGKFACDISGDSLDEILESIKKGNVILPEKSTRMWKIVTKKIGMKTYRKIKKGFRKLC